MFELRETSRTSTRTVTSPTIVRSCSVTCATVVALAVQTASDIIHRSNCNMMKQNILFWLRRLHPLCRSVRRTTRRRWARKNPHGGCSPIREIPMSLCGIPIDTINIKVYNTRRDFEEDKGGRVRYIRHRRRKRVCCVVLSYKALKRRQHRVCQDSGSSGSNVP